MICRGASELTDPEMTKCYQQPSATEIESLQKLKTKKTMPDSVH